VTGNLYIKIQGSVSCDQLDVSILTRRQKNATFNFTYSETSLIGPPMGPYMSGPINEVALLLKTSVMWPLKNWSYYWGFSANQQPWTMLACSSRNYCIPLNCKIYSLYKSQLVTSSHSTPYHISWHTTVWYSLLVSQHWQQVE